MISPAKINLNLSITGRRENDYHILDSVMVFTKWGDDITLKPSNEFKLTADGPYAGIFTKDLLSTAINSPNLIVKATHALTNNRNIVPNIHIHVNKNIPSGAGLGGGSSNAACAMHMLNQHWGLDLSLSELCGIGLNLGAELPVCLYAQSSRVCGIGDVIEPISIPQLPLLIVWPDESLLTKDVFDKYRDLDFPFSEPHKMQDDFESWLRSTNNDLVGAAVELCPEIAVLLSDLKESDGCRIAQMSGSGSACFAVFETIEQAETAQSKFKNSVTTHTQA